MVKKTAKIEIGYQMDKFVQEIQKCKMKELWDNRFDDSYDKCC